MTDRLDLARWDADQRPAGSLVVACVDPSCAWRQSVVVWPHGYHEAARLVKTLLDEHLTRGECQWTSSRST
jgi:hypothetical protein